MHGLSIPGAIGEVFQRGFLFPTGASYDSMTFDETVVLDGTRGHGTELTYLHLFMGVRGFLFFLYKLL